MSVSLLLYFKAYTKGTSEETAIPRFRIAYSKPTKRFVAKSVKKPKSYAYLRTILNKVIKRAEDHRKVSDRKRMNRKLPLVSIAPQERPIRAETIEKSTKMSRLKLKR